MRLQARRGFTLAEVIIASGIMSVVLLGMGSAMMVAAHAAPGRNGLTDLTLQAGRATDQLSTDVASATSFSILGAGSIEMQVPDRTGDGLADTVRYAWSGVSGAPLNRTFNNGSAVTVATDVRQFSLGYVKAATKQATSYTESGEQLIFMTDNSSSYSTYSVPTSNSVGISILPTMPSNAAYFRITRVDFQLVSKGNSSAEVRASLRNGTGLYNIPAATNDYAKIFAPSTTAWVEAVFSQNVKLTPGKTAVILLSNVNGSTDFSASIRSYYGYAALCYSTDGGVSWSTDGSRTLPAYVYGVYAVKNADAYTYNLTQVTCAMKCGNSANTQIRSDWRTLNAPQVSGP